MKFLLISLLNFIREIIVTYMIYFGQEPTILRQIAISHEIRLSLHVYLLNNQITKLEMGILHGV